MKRLMGFIALGALGLATGAAAHDTATPHETRGDCERAMAHINSEDRERLAANFPNLFDSRGEAMNHLIEDFQCEYDDEDDAWYIVDHRFD